MERVERPDRRAFLQTGALAGVAAFVARGVAGAETSAPGAAAHLALEDVTVSELQERMTAGTLTAYSLTAACLARIVALDAAGPELHSVIETNPDALEIARALDDERRAKGPRGPLHGIPVLLKDNIDTADRLATTAGSLALAGSSAPRDAFLAERLRAAGAILLGKANMSEWANIR
jgi:amidase